jgi:hypothetical protein
LFLAPASTTAQEPLGRLRKVGMIPIDSIAEEETNTSDGFLFLKEDEMMIRGLLQDDASHSFSMSMSMSMDS